MNCKKQVFLLISMLFAGVFPIRGQSPVDWENPAVVQINKLEPHASFFPFENREKALTGNPSESEYYRSLNGTWKFHWVRSPEQRPKEFYKTDFNDSDWADFPVPANWEVNGYGIPIYVNIPYEFAPDNPNPPDIPDGYNPVGSYRKRVSIPDQWMNRRIFIHFGAVKSAFYLWINGVKVGYSQVARRRRSSTSLPLCVAVTI